MPTEWGSADEDHMVFLSGDESKEAVEARENQARTELRALRFCEDDASSSEEDNKSNGGNRDKEEMSR